MKIRIISAGYKPKLDYARSGIAEYQKRLRRYGQVEFITVKEGDSKSVSARLLEASAGTFRIALDERGERLTTIQLSAVFEEWLLKPDIKKISFLIGASEGHTQALRDSSNLVLSLSSLCLLYTSDAADD